MVRRGTTKWDTSGRWNQDHLLLGLLLQTALVFLQVQLSFGGLLSLHLEPHLMIGLQGCQAVLVLIQQVLDLLLVHLQFTFPSAQIQCEAPHNIHNAGASLLCKMRSDASQ